ncbi:MAG: TetR/AcrR family transcriptional regulator [Acidimicrobiales bacterium]
MASSGRPRLQSAAARRQALIAAATRALAADPEASMESIARAAGCARASAYELFETKEQLLGAVLEEEADQFQRVVLAARASSLGQPLDIAVRARVAAMLGFARARPDGYMLLSRLALDATVGPAPPLDRVRQEVLDHLERTIGPLPARMILGLLRAVALGLAEADPEQDEWTINVTATFIIGGLKELALRNRSNPT